MHESRRSKATIRYATPVASATVGDDQSETPIHSTQHLIGCKRLHETWRSVLWLYEALLYVARLLVLIPFILIYWDLYMRDSYCV